MVFQMSNIMLGKYTSILNTRRAKKLNNADQKAAEKESRPEIQKPPSNNRWKKTEKNQKNTNNRT